LKILDYLNTIQKQEKPLKFLISKILIRLKLSHLFNFKYKHHILKFYPTFLSRVLWINPQRSHSGDEAENFIWNYLKKDDVFIDIGANIGTTTLEASKKIGSNGKIFSFEPNPRIFKFLQGNILLNKCKNVELFNCALGSKSTHIYFSDIYTDESNSVQQNNIGKIVKMKTLDEIIPEVTVPPKPYGFPIAMTQSPTRALSESPKLTVSNFSSDSICKTAKSI